MSLYRWNEGDSWLQLVRHIAESCEEAVTLRASHAPFYLLPCYPHGVRTPLNKISIEKQFVNEMKIVPLSRLERRIVVANHALDVLQHRQRALHDFGGAGVHHVALAFRGAVLALEIVEVFSFRTLTTQMMLKEYFIRLNAHSSWFLYLGFYTTLARLTLALP